MIARLLMTIRLYSMYFEFIFRSCNLQILSNNEEKFNYVRLRFPEFSVSIANI